MAATPTANPSQTRRWSVDEVTRMVETGILHEDEKIELIDGELLVVTPQGPAHGNTLARLTRILSATYGSGFTMRVQLPLQASSTSLPEPDLAVAAADGPWEAEQRHPRCDESLLVIEVAATTHAEARRKSATYATAGVPVYWIVDVRRREIVEHTGPRPDGGWDRVTAIAASAEIPLPGTDGRMAVGDALLPSPGGRPG